MVRRAAADAPPEPQHTALRFFCSLSRMFFHMCCQTFLKRARARDTVDAVHTYFYVHPWSTQALQCPARLVRSSRATHACPLARSRSPSLAHAMTHPYAAHTRLSRLALKRMRSINSSEYRFWCSRCMMSMIVSCARKHASHERHAHQQPGDRGVRMRLGRGSVPDGRRRPCGCRWPFRPTGGPWPSACARSCLLYTSDAADE